MSKTTYDRIPGIPQCFDARVTPRWGGGTSYYTAAGFSKRTRETEREYNAASSASTPRLQALCMSLPSKETVRKRIMYNIY